MDLDVEDSSPSNISIKIQPLDEIPKFYKLFDAVNIIVLLSFITVLVIFVFVLRKKRNADKSMIVNIDDNWTKKFAENMGLLKFGNPKVFLLYPRDCEPFMEAMSKFRQVLRRANCEVCYQFFSFYFS